MSNNNLKNIIDNSLIEVETALDKDEKYINLCNQYKNIISKIEEALPEDKRSLLKELRDVDYCTMQMIVFNSFCKGIKNAPAIIKEAHEVRESRESVLNG